MACTRRGRTPKARSGAAGSPPAVDSPPEVLYAEPTEVLKPLSGTGNTARDRVAQWIYYRSAQPGITNKEIAERLGIAPTSLNRILYQARKEGWLVIEDPLTKVEVELLPKIVENLNYHLDRKDIKVTVEAAKGLLFPLWKESQGIEENKIQVLGIKIEMPPSGQITPGGQIHGTPRKPGQAAELPRTIDATFTSNPDE